MEKKKRGRPRKYPIVEVKEKRKRGRPRKYPLAEETKKDKKPKEIVESIESIDSIEKRKPGRPKKVRIEVSIPEVPPLNPPRIGKHAGYCNACYQDLATFDGETVTENNDICLMFTCWKCGQRQKNTELLNDVPIKKSGIKYRSKKEYLEDCLAVNDDSVPFHAPDVINKKDLGVNVDPIESEGADEIFE